MPPGPVRRGRSTRERRRYYAKYGLDHPADEQVGAQMKKFDFRAVLDNSIVDRLVKQGFFERLFGSGVKAEEERKAKIAFR